jgi:hypothetical protein
MSWKGHSNHSTNIPNLSNIKTKMSQFRKKLGWWWGTGLVVEHLSTMLEALGPTPSSAKNKQTKPEISTNQQGKESYGTSP